jgi:hypothetical protein
MPKPKRAAEPRTPKAIFARLVLAFLRLELRGQYPAGSQHYSQMETVNRSRNSASLGAV